MEHNEMLQVEKNHLLSKQSKNQPILAGSSLKERFNLYFEVVPANTNVLIRQARRLRYQVYCVENKVIQDPRCCQNMMMQDEYDSHSVYSIIKYRRTGMFAGTARIILPDLQEPSKQFPIEKNCKSVTSIFSHLNIRRENIAEISPFVVSSNFKRRKGEKSTICGVSPCLGTLTYFNDERSSYPHIVMGLLASVFVMSAEHKIRYWYAFMEPPLMTLLDHFGVDFTPIGTLTNYLGKNVPTVAEVNGLLLSIQAKCPGLWELIIEISRQWKSLQKKAINI
jgi:N-acyl amino acid synthase of PEP-CTERM/exosortase system